MPVLDTLPSSFRFNNVETVDTAFSDIVRPNLFADTTFTPDMFNKSYDIDSAGQILTRVLGYPTVSNAVATTATGLTIPDPVEVADKIISFKKDQVVASSQRVNKAVTEFRNSGTQADLMYMFGQNFKEKIQAKIMGLLLAAPAATDDIQIGGATYTADSGNGAFTTSDAFFASILATIEQIKVNGGRANTIIISPQMTTLLLLASTKFGNAYLPETNEEARQSGKIGKLFGIKVKESNLIGTGSPVAGNAMKPVAGRADQCQYIIYDKDAFALGMYQYGPTSEKIVGQDATVLSASANLGGGIVNPALAYANYTTLKVGP